MTSLIDTMKSKPYFYCSGGVNEQSISEAEELLHLKFAEDYKTYLLNIGCASFDSHELTGLNIGPRLNVINVTQNYDLKEMIYVIEELNIDGIIIGQNSSGKVFMISNEGTFSLIAESLLEYIS